MDIKKLDVVYVPVNNYAKKDVEVLLSVNGVPYKFRELKDVYVLNEKELKVIKDEELKTGYEKGYEKGYNEGFAECEQEQD